MRLTTLTNRVLRKLSGVHVSRLPGPPGWFRLEQIAEALADAPVGLIVDAGANVGQSALEFSQAFPEATIHAFEPVSATHRQLCRNIQGSRNIVPHPLGLSDADGSRPMYLSSADTSNTLSLLGGDATRGTEMVRLTTLDRFCQAQGISRIDLLKVDTEGHDLAVLKGATTLLAGTRAIQVECSIEAGDPRYVHVQEFIGFLSCHGFHLIGIYDQVRSDDGSRVAFCNALFLRQWRGG